MTIKSLLNKETNMYLMEIYVIGLINIGDMCNGLMSMTPSVIFGKFL